MGTKTVALAVESRRASQWNQVGGLIWTLVRTDFATRYHGTLGGFVWALLRPFSTFVVLMGVSGVGKTTIGKALADDLGWTFIEADDFRKTFLAQQMMQSIASTPEAYAELIRTDSRHWSEVIRAAGLKVE